MTDLSGVSAATTQTKTASPAASDGKQPAPAQDFETFLGLLTAQLRNQDPLNPLNSTDFVAQLASFSAVEQQVRTNDLLQALVAGSGLGGAGGGAESVAGLIGRTVEAPVATIAFDGLPVTLPVRAPAGGTVVVSDGEGAVVARVPVAAGAESAVWDGKAGDGPAPAGTYDVAFEGEGGAIARSGTVEAVTRDGDGWSLVLADGQAVALETVTAVR